jgi:hypothetical protein
MKRTRRSWPMRRNGATVPSEPSAPSRFLPFMSMNHRPSWATKPSMFPLGEKAAETTAPGARPNSSLPSFTDHTPSSHASPVCSGCAPKALAMARRLPSWPTVRSRTGAAAWLGGTRMV